MTEATFDLTPDPKVLIALTRTPLSPLDALCELIDNSIDGFMSASLQGIAISSPIIAINLPSRTEVRDGLGVVQVLDNGPGMTAASTENAIRAGFSGNNPFDSLGLFGMGFNIATGKIGRSTQLLTCREEDTELTAVKIDLDRIRLSRNFRVPYASRPKPAGFTRGTQLHISGWWPLGDANHGFVGKLVQYGLPSIRRELGRRYATILRKHQTRIIVNDGECVPFEHCAWSGERYVERRGHGQIPAKFDFNEAIGTQRRCTICTAIVEQGDSRCKTCGSDSFRSIQERVEGWLGVQRFDDATDYGVDLIRNGRAIRIGEKAALFEFVDELKRVTKDYPIDQQYGRIVGEVHLDQVPVDFLKQDFQRSSPEWARAMEYLRGASSLQPNAEGAKENRSPMFKLYQGYRRVRTPGRTDLYMGYWDVDDGKPKRVSREKEREYYRLFEERQPGFFDDTEWWKLVEEADQPPALELATCHQCGAQNTQEAEVCQVCAAVLRGHSCINPDCPAKVPFSAENCPVCGTPQDISENTSWTCNICRRRNSATTTHCAGCGAAKEDLDPLGEPALLSDSNLDSVLSRRGVSIRMPDGSASQPLDLEVYRTTRALQAFGTSDRAPIVRYASLSVLKVFVDPTHPLFKTFRQPVDVAVAEEISHQILAISPGASGPSMGHLYSVSAIAVRVLQALLGTPDSPEEVFRQDAAALFATLRERFASVFDGIYRDLYETMDESEKRALAENLIAHRIDILQLNELVDTGSFLEYVGVGTLRRAIDEYPQRLFDGAVWKSSYTSLTQLSEQVANEQQLLLRRRYSTLLGDVAEHYDRPDNDTAMRERASASLRFLRMQMT